MNLDFINLSKNFVEKQHNINVLVIDSRDNSVAKYECRMGYVGELWKFANEKLVPKRKNCRKNFGQNALVQKFSDIIS